MLDHSTIIFFSVYVTTFYVSHVLYCTCTLGVSYRLRVMQAIERHVTCTVFFVNSTALTYPFKAFNSLEQTWKTYIAVYLSMYTLPEKVHLNGCVENVVISKWQRPNLLKLLFLWHSVLHVTSHLWLCVNNTLYARLKYDSLWQLYIHKQPLHFCKNNRSIVDACSFSNEWKCDHTFFNVNNFHGHEYSVFKAIIINHYHFFLLFCCLFVRISFFFHLLIKPFSILVCLDLAFCSITRYTHNTKCICYKFIRNICGYCELQCTRFESCYNNECVIDVLLW